MKNCKKKLRELDSEKVRLGAFIQRHRKEKGYTQQEIADMLGITLKSVSCFECGLTYPSHENLFKLTKILDMSLDEYVSSSKRFFGKSSSEEIDDIFNDLSVEEQDLVIEIIKAVSVSIKNKKYR